MTQAALFALFSALGLFAETLVESVPELNADLPPRIRLGKISMIQEQFPLSSNILQQTHVQTLNISRFSLMANGSVR